jgi:hypothetical protein
VRETTKDALSSRVGRILSDDMVVLYMDGLRGGRLLLRLARAAEKIYGGMQHDDQRRAVMGCLDVLSPSTELVSKILRSLVGQWRTDLDRLW